MGKATGMAMAAIMTARAASSGREECFGMGDPPLLEPVEGPCGPVFGMQVAYLLQVFLARRPDKRERDRTERHVEEPSALR